MNILMVSDVYFPRVNGVSSSIRTFARELKRLGHAVTIVAPDYGVNGDEQPEFDMIRLPARTIFFDPEDRLIRGSAINDTIDRLSSREWDIIHIHTPFRAHQLGVKLARRLGKPTVESYHTFFEEYVGHYLPWLPKRLSRFAARYFSRRLCHGVDHLIVPSDEMTRVLQRYGITTPSSVIPTGIHLEEFRGGDGLRFRRAHGIEDDQPTIVTVSRLSAEKNIGFLLDVAQVLIDAFPRLIFILAGEGPDAERLKRHAKQIGLDGHVVFVGNLDRRTQLLDCYKAGDVFVFASPTETQGLVLLEAMSLGVPIVSTAVMGTATVLKNARSARISSEDVGEFAANVAVLLRSMAERKKLAEAGPGDAEAWSAPVLMEKVVSLYRTLSTTKTPAVSS